jgi:hypothetical protein
MGGWYSDIVIGINDEMLVGKDARAQNPSQIFTISIPDSEGVLYGYVIYTAQTHNFKVLFIFIILDHYVWLHLSLDPFGVCVCVCCRGRTVLYPYIYLLAILLCGWGHNALANG